MTLKEVWDWAPYKPYPQTLDGRLLRLFCHSVGHHPRSYTGSWCFGYDYVCDRCGMYADRWSTKEIK